MEVFGPSDSDALAQAAGAPVIARIPLDPALAALCDRGDIEDYTGDFVADLGTQVSAAAPAGAD